LKFQHLIWRGHEQEQYAKSDIKISLCLSFSVALVDSVTAAAVVNLVAVVHLIAVVNRIDVVNRVECTLSRMPTCFRCTLGSCNCWRCSKIVRCSKSSREQTFKLPTCFRCTFTFYNRCRCMCVVNPVAVVNLLAVVNLAASRLLKVPTSFRCTLGSCNRCRCFPRFITSASRSFCTAVSSRVGRLNTSSLSTRSSNMRMPCASVLTLPLTPRTSST